MKKWVSSVVIAALVSAGVGHTPGMLNAATAIQIYIDNERLPSPQAPVMKGNRVLVPLRSIFEGLDANVLWNNKTKTVTASKGDQTVSMTIGSSYATISGSRVTLDVPASIIKGSTMVPIRFVTEALGEEVLWNSSAKRVDIMTSSNDLSSSTVTTRVGTQYGDARDISVEFTPSQNEGGVHEYRVMLVKASNAGSFNLNEARNVSYTSYTSVSRTNGKLSVTLKENALDTAGQKIQSGTAYRVYVLTVGNDASDFSYVLSSAKDPITMNAKPAVAAASEVKIRDIANHGDGRDLEVSFKQPGTTSDITNYRIFVVKQKDASSFDVTAASRAANSYSTPVNKSSSSTLTTTLSSGTRDSSGEVIKNGIPYVVYIYSTSSNTNNKQHKLSSASSAITLDSATLTAPTITAVNDVNDYGNGRDIQLSFNRAGNEAKVGFYRIYVVRNNQASSFNMTEANKLGSDRYYDISKTGNNITTTLPEKLKDSSGNTIREGETYRVFVASMGNQQGGYSNLLSGASAQITLVNNSVTKPISGLAVNDIQDYGDGRDLRVSFNKSSNEANVDHYRVFVVKSGNAGAFDVSKANSMNSSRYTRVNKTGGNLSVALSADARDTDGSIIRSGVSYRVFVLAVSNRGDSKLNSLSGASSVIQLSASSAQPASSVEAVVNGNSGDGRDVTVKFKKASDETGLSRYLVMVVRADEASRFDLSWANRVDSGNYTAVAKKGSDLSQVLNENTKDVRGDRLTPGTNYKVFVLSLADGKVRSENALSQPSNTFAINKAPVAVDAAVITKVENKPAENPAIKVDFNKAGNEAGLSFYAVIAVKAANADQFTLEQANALPRSQYTAVSRSGDNLSAVLDTYALDADGSTLKAGVTYRIFVLSVADGDRATVNSLSRASDTIVMEELPAAAAPQTQSTSGNQGKEPAAENL
ncbi:copper amine oxidase N-terminal domain-containing protein [Paenibacillus urinalis]|uniref:copper amine oxidase N-terminal domain-containing protein n=1 Tax=Paenibacillus urinalis TaxID=521520 RepID=UPI00196073B7